MRMGAQLLFMKTDQLRSSPLKTKLLAENVKALKREASGIFQPDSCASLPEPVYRSYNSTSSPHERSAHMKKQVSLEQKSNLSVLLRDFQQIRTNIKQMQHSNQRIVDKIQRSYEGPKIMGVSRSSRVGEHSNGYNEMGTNYRFEVEEVEPLQGIDQAFQKNCLEDKINELNRKLQQQIGNSSYYKFQVWMMKDLLVRNGIKLSDANQQCIPTPDTDTSHQTLIQQHLTTFMKGTILPKLDQIDRHLKKKLQKLVNLQHIIDLKLNLKLSHAKTKKRFSVDMERSRRVEKDDRDGRIMELEESYRKKCEELGKFREEVGAYTDKVRSEYTFKMQQLELELKDKDDKLKLKAAQSPKKQEKFRQETDRLNRLVVELNSELDVKEERLSERQTKISLLEQEIAALQRKNSALQLQVKNLKTAEANRQLIKWPQMTSSFILDPLQRSNLPPVLLQTAINTSDPIDNSRELLFKKLQLAEQSNNKLRQELDRFKEGDRKLYKSVLNSQYKLLDSARDIRFQSKIPKSKIRMNSGLREDSLANTFSKISGGKQLSLNLSFDEEYANIHQLDIEEMISRPDYPFETLRLTSSDALYLVMKMAQMLRYYRVEIKDKNRLLKFLRSRQQVELKQQIESEQHIHLSDFQDNCSEVDWVKPRKKGYGWQHLQKQSMQMIQKLNERIEGLQTQLQKAERNQNNLIQMKQLYKQQIVKLNRLNQQYQVHYKQQILQLTGMLKHYQQGKNLASVREITMELRRIYFQEPHELKGTQFKDYLNMLVELLESKQAPATAAKQQPIDLL